jgi:hypothetical protein
MKTPTPTKTEEIALLQSFIAASREAGALYLYDALMALAMPFEHAIRSDFPGSAASLDAIHATRDARQEINGLKATISTEQNKLQELANKTSETARSYHYAKQQLDDLKTAARRLINI